MVLNIKSRKVIIRHKILQILIRSSILFASYLLFDYLFFIKYSLLLDVSDLRKHIFICSFEYDAIANPSNNLSTRKKCNNFKHFYKYVTPLYTCKYVDQQQNLFFINIYCFKTNYLILFL